MGQDWSTERRLGDEDVLAAAIVELTVRYSRWRQRRVTVLLKRDRRHVDDKRAV